MPASIFVSFVLLGIEDIGVQIEEPFDVLPLWQYCDAIGASCDQLQLHRHAFQENEAHDLRWSVVEKEDDDDDAGFLLDLTRDDEGSKASRSSYAGGALRGSWALGKRAE